MLKIPTTLFSHVKAYLQVQNTELNIHLYTTASLTPSQKLLSAIV